MSGSRIYVAAVLGALALGAAWWMPGSAWCALLGWVAAGCMVVLARNKERPYWASYVCGVLVNILGFYWLLATIADFGGFPLLPALTIFALFVLLSAVQFPLFMFMYRLLPTAFESVYAGTAAAWVLTELIAVRIFPWHLGHTQLGFLPLAQAADLAGSLLLSWLMMWTAESVLRRILHDERKYLVWAAPLCLAAAVGYGSWRMQHFAEPPAASRQIAIAQANISVAEKHNLKYFVHNTDRYLELTAGILAAHQDLLIIWPESVVMEWIPAFVRNAADDQRVPYFGPGAALLFGAQTFDPGQKYYNSAVAVFPDGSMPPPYHKQILMPFGEYMPFANAAPWLRQFNPALADFSAGRGARVFDYPLKGENGDAGILRVAPLICYEDVVPELARAAVNAGAEVLVNLANDAWFGDTAAPAQHHLIAAFRAIENRRFLIRSTNSGLTAVVDPVGRTAAELPVLAEDILMTKVYPVRELSLYTRHVGDKPWWLLLVVVLLAALWNQRAQRKSRRTARR